MVATPWPRARAGCCHISARSSVYYRSARHPYGRSTVPDVGLTFPIAVLTLDDAARLSDARLVVLIGDDPDPGSGVPLTVRPPVHGEGVLAWSLDAFINLLTRKDLGESVDDLLDDYPAYVMCGYRTAEMVLGEGADFIDRGTLLKLGDPSSPAGRAVFLDSNDLRLVLQSGHDPVSCRCARGRILPLVCVLKSLMADRDSGAA